MIAAKNKRIPKYEDYISYSELVSMLNAVLSLIRNGGSWNYRVFATTVHLVLEVTMKKMALLYGYPVSVTSHNSAGLLYDLKDVDAFAGQVVRSMSEKGTFRLLQKFPYDALRFDSKIDVSLLISPEDLLNVTSSALRRLEYLKASRIGKK